MGLTLKGAVEIAVIGGAIILGIDKLVNSEKLEKEQNYSNSLLKKYESLNTKYDCLSKKYNNLKVDHDSLIQDYIFCDKKLWETNMKKKYFEKLSKKQRDK